MEEDEQKASDGDTSAAAWSDIDNAAKVKRLVSRSLQPSMRKQDGLVQPVDEDLKNSIRAGSAAKKKKAQVTAPSKDDESVGSESEIDVQQQQSHGDAAGASYSIPRQVSVAVTEPPPHQMHQLQWQPMHFGASHAPPMQHNFYNYANQPGIGYFTQVATGYHPYYGWQGNAPFMPQTYQVQPFDGGFGAGIVEQKGESDSSPELPPYHSAFTNPAVDAAPGRQFGAPTQLPSAGKMPPIPQTQQKQQPSAAQQAKKKRNASKKNAKHPALQHVMTLLQQAETTAEESKQVAQMLTLDILPSNMTVECAMDHKITRFIQERLEKQLDEKELERFVMNLFCRHRADDVDSQQSDFYKLVNDMYGNYVLQKLLAKLHAEQLDVIFHRMMPSLPDYVVHKHACRVVQVALELFSPPQMATVYSIVIEGQSDEGAPLLRHLGFDFYGNHVIQKLARRIEELSDKLIYSQFVSQVQSNLMDFCTHEFGCRVVQRLIENTKGEPQRDLVTAVLQEYDELIVNQYGTFVLCCTLERGGLDHQQYLLERVTENFAQMSLDRDGSKLLENCFKLHGKVHEAAWDSQDEQLLRVFERLTHLFDMFIGVPIIKCEPPLFRKVQPGEICFTKIILSEYGNYVVQTAYEQANQFQRRHLLSRVQATLQGLTVPIEQSPIRHVIEFLQTKYNINVHEEPFYEWPGLYQSKAYHFSDYRKHYDSILMNKKATFVFKKK